MISLSYIYAKIVRKYLLGKALLDCDIDKS